MDFGSYAGYGIPYQVVTAVDAALDRHLRLRRGFRPRRLPDPGEPAHRGRLGRPHPAWSTRTPAGSTSCSPRARSAARGRPAAARPGTCARTRSARPAGRAPTPPACRSCPGLVRYDEVAAGAIAHALRFTTNRDPDGLHLPGAPLGRARQTSSSLPPMGLRVRLKASLRHEPASRRRRGSSRRRSSATG